MRIEITLQLRRKPGANLEATVDKLSSQALADRKYLTRTELATQAGAAPEDVAKIDSFAHEHRLTVVEANIAQRTVKLAGTVADLSAAFGAKLMRYKSGAVSYRGRTGTLTIPADLSGIIESVLGLDDRPVVETHFRLLDKASASTLRRSVKRGQKAGASARATAVGQPRSCSPPSQANKPRGPRLSRRCFANCWKEIASPRKLPWRRRVSHASFIQIS